MEANGHIPQVERNRIAAEKRQARKDAHTKHMARKARCTARWQREERWKVVRPYIKEQFARLLEMGKDTQNADVGSWDNAEKEYPPLSADQMPAELAEPVASDTIHEAITPDEYEKAYGWVAANMSRKTLLPAEAPNEFHYSLWFWMQKNKKEFHRRLHEIMTKRKAPLPGKSFDDSDDGPDGIDMTKLLEKG